MSKFFLLKSLILSWNPVNILSNSFQNSCLILSTWLHCWWYDSGICHLPLNPHPFIISFLATCPALCVAHWSVIAYPSILENKMLTKPHNCCCKLSSWSSRQNNNICQNWVRPNLWGAPDVPSGLVEFLKECALREQSTQAWGSSKKTGREFTWSCESECATWQALLYPLQPGWERVREGPLVADQGWLAPATWLHSDQILPGPDMLWRNNVNPVRRLFHQILDIF